MSRPPRDKPEEEMAVRVVEALEPVRLHRADKLGASPGTWDFDVEREGEMMGALEVTTLMDQKRQGFDAALYERPVLRDTGLSRTWNVGLSEEALEPRRGVNDIRARLVPALAELEERGLDDFNRDPMRSFRLEIGLDEPPLLLMDELPVNFAMVASSAEDEPAVYLVGPAIGSRVTAENTHNAIQTALTGERLRGERDKLSRSGRDERHLFVWIAHTLFAEYSGIASEEAPMAAAPSLPDEITQIWVAAAGSDDVIVVWRSSGEHWVRDTVDLAL